MRIRNLVIGVAAGVSVLGLGGTAVAGPALASGEVIVTPNTATPGGTPWVHGVECYGEEGTATSEAFTETVKLEPDHGTEGLVGKATVANVPAGEYIVNVSCPQGTGMGKIYVVHTAK